MADKRKIEIFSAGCPLCLEATAMVENMSCDSCEISVLEMSDPAVAERAGNLGIRTIPAVVIDGRLSDCCAGSGLDAAVLKKAGIGQPL